MTKRVIQKWLAMLSALMLAPTQLSTPVFAQQEELAPFLPLTSTMQMPHLKNDLLWDPQYKKTRVRNKFAIKGLKNQIKELEDKDRKSTSDNTANRLKLLENYLNLAFFELTKKRKSPAEEVPNEAKEVFRKAARLGELLRDNAKNPTEKARIGYNEQVSKYYAKLQDFSVAQIDEIGKKIPLATYIQLRLLDAMDAVENGTEAARFAAVKKLEPLGPKMFERQAIVANLLIARTLANIDGEGNFTREPNPGYKTYLTKATELAASLPKEFKDEVFNYALTVWRVAEREQATWDTLPIDLANYKDSSLIPAIRERLAISLAIKRNFIGAAKAYAVIRPLLEKKGLGVKVDDRTAVLHRYDYINSGNPRSYQLVLENLQKKYNSGKIKTTDETKKFLEKLDSFAQEMAANEAGKGLAQGANAANRKQALVVLAQRLKAAKQPREQEDIRFQMASLYSADRNFEPAFELYFKLGQDSKVSKANRSKYMYLALQTKQEQLKWPLDNPFPVLDQKDPLGEDQQKSLAELRDVTRGFFEMVKDDKEQSWPVIAHLGVVEARLGNQDGAAQLWTEHLTKLQPSQVAPYVAGYAARFFYDLQHWDKLETLARVLLRKKITPVTMTQQLDAGQLLGTALIHAATKDIKEKRASKATRRLTEFVKNFGNHPQHDEGMFRLASAYQDLGRHDMALKVMFELVKAHGKSPYAEKVLKGGGSYALGLGQEEGAIKMYEAFVSQGPRTIDYVPAVSKLADLYVATARVNLAEKTLVRALKLKELLPEQKNQLGAQLLDLESRFASPKLAKKAALFLQKTVPDNPVVALKVNLFEARALQEAPYNPKRMKDLMAFLAAQPDRPEELTVEDTAEIRYIVANKEGEDLLAKIDQSGGNPLKDLEANYARFKSIEIAFLKVCDTGENSFCAVAQFKLQQLCQKIVDAYGDLDVGEQLTGQKLQKYVARKQVIIKEVKEIAGTSLATAQAELAKGNTSGELAQEIKAASSKGGQSIPVQAARFFLQVDTTQKDPELKVFKEDKKTVVKKEASRAKAKAKPVMDADDADVEDDSDDIEE